MRSPAVTASETGHTDSRRQPVDQYRDRMMMQWPEGSAGLQTGCRAGVYARIGSGSMTKSHTRGTSVLSLKSQQDKVVILSERGPKRFSAWGW